MHFHFNLLSLFDLASLLITIQPLLITIQPLIPVPTIAYLGLLLPFLLFAFSFLAQLQSKSFDLQDA
jgi:hypothetical protein